MTENPDGGFFSCCVKNIAPCPDSIEVLPSRSSPLPGSGFFGHRFPSGPRPGRAGGCTGHCPPCSSSSPRRILRTWWGLIITRGGERRKTARNARFHGHEPMPANSYIQGLKIPVSAVRFCPSAPPLVHDYGGSAIAAGPPCFLERRRYAAWEANPDYS